MGKGGAGPPPAKETELDSAWHWGEAKSCTIKIGTHLPQVLLLLLPGNTVNSLQVT